MRAVEAFDLRSSMEQSSPLELAPLKERRGRVRERLVTWTGPVHKKGQTPYSLRYNIERSPREKISWTFPRKENWTNGHPEMLKYSQVSTAAVGHSIDEHHEEPATRTNVRRPLNLSCCR